jgi:hypothetical protein
MQVMRESEQQRPQLRRLGDQLGAFYTPVALVIAIAAWAISGEAVRFLAVLVVATPCPLLIAIPVAIIGSVSLAARRGIVIKDPAILEKLDTVAARPSSIKRGRLPTANLKSPRSCWRQTSQKNHSCTRSPVWSAIRAIPCRAPSCTLPTQRTSRLTDPTEVSERPGEGLRGLVDGRIRCRLPVEKN